MTKSQPFALKKRILKKTPQNKFKQKYDFYTFRVLKRGDADYYTASEEVCQFKSFTLHLTLYRQTHLKACLQKIKSKNLKPKSIKKTKLQKTKLSTQISFNDSIIKSSIRVISKR